MKLLIVISFLCVFSACQVPDSTSLSVTSELVGTEIPNKVFDISEVHFMKNGSYWIHPFDSTKVSGHVVQYYADGQVAEKFKLLNGEKEGVLRAYFPNGELRFIESYRNNKLDGKVKRWTMEEGHQLITLLNYTNGKLDGEQKKWYSTGELHKLMNISMGREEGLQQAFRKNGALYANYEARNGRVFGMKRSNLCYELDNEQVLYKQ